MDVASTLRPLQRGSGDPAFAVVGSVVWLRVSALQDQQVRQAQRQQKRRLEQARTRVAATARPTRPTADLAAGPAVSSADPHTVPVADETPGSWKPVPVPHPTYTLKEPAYRPEPAPDTGGPVPI